MVLGGDGIRCARGGHVGAQPVVAYVTILLAPWAWAENSLECFLYHSQLAPGADTTCIAAIIKAARAFDILEEAFTVENQHARDPGRPVEGARRLDDRRD